MANTSPDNISYPTNASSKKTIEEHIQDTANSVQSAVTSRRISSKSAAYSLVATDSNSVLRFTNSTAVALTIDNVLPVGASVEVVQDGAGQVTFTAGSGVTLSSGAGYGTKFRYGRALIICVASGEYRVTGDIRKVVSASGGNSVTSDALYYYHTFTSNGTFTVTGATGIICDYLVVAGGGGGGGGENQNGYGGGGGGGGAGGLISRQSKLITPNSYPVVIGGGGGGGASGSTNTASSGGYGSNTTAFGETAVGGGAGGAENAGQGYAGGSGGGMGGDGSSGATIGTGTPAQGNQGAAGDYRCGAGGGGSGGIGVRPANAYHAGDGGPGVVWLNGGIYAGGGGGGAGGTDQAGFGGLGGYGGGGNGSRNGPSTGWAGHVPTAGGANSGGGGGAAGAGVNVNGYSGGSGIVIVRYLKSEVE